MFVACADTLTAVCSLDGMGWSVTECLVSLQATPDHTDASHRTTHVIICLYPHGMLYLEAGFYTQQLENGFRID